MSPRILHIDTEKTWRGGERQLFYLLEGLQTRGIECLTVCQRESPLNSKLVGADHDSLEIGPAFWSWKDLLEAGRWADIIHAHASRAHNIGACLKIFTGRPLVVTRRVSFEPGKNILTRLKYRLADRIVAISADISENLVSWGANPGTLRVISSAAANLVRPEDKEREKLKKELGVDPEKPIVGTIGALVGNKDHRTFIMAASKLRRFRDDIYFVIVGGGPLYDRLKELGASADLGRHLVMTGFRWDAEKILSVFDALVLSSKMEGLGSVVLDAFSLGVPVAATSEGGLKDILDHGRTGLWSSPGAVQELSDNILRLLEDKELTARLTKNAYELVKKKHSVDGMVDRYCRLYDEILEKER